jgi:hypothetical protein
LNACSRRRIRGERARSAIDSGTTSVPTPSAGW